MGVQETKLDPDPCTATDCIAVCQSVAPAIAKALGWCVYDQRPVNDALWANLFATDLAAAEAADAVYVTGDFNE